jgi:nucleotide-binding universal stress UspA family protein
MGTGSPSASAPEQDLERRSDLIGVDGAPGPRLPHADRHTGEGGDAVTFADVMVRVIPSAPRELERLVVAVDLARRVGGRLNGVFVRQDHDDKADWAHALFDRAARRSSLETTWRVVPRHNGAGLLFLARRSDLAVLPSMGVLPVLAGHPLGEVSFESGRPVLILPPPQTDMSIGNTVLVAWNGSREAARAVHDALPILVEAEKVFVLTVLKPDAPEPIVDAPLLEHLRQHGVAAELLRRRSEEAGDEIASEARRTGADMIVIGLHRRASSGEIELGDVSERFGRTGSMPIFCSH